MEELYGVGVERDLAPELFEPPELMMASRQARGWAGQGGLDDVTVFEVLRAFTDCSSVN